MAIVIISKNPNQQDWKDHLLTLDPSLDIRIYPNDGNKEEIDFAIAWKPPHGVFSHYPNLRCIASTGAGVDHIIKDETIGDDIRITRVVDNRLAKDMTTYLVAQVMAHLRDITKYKLSQLESKWQPAPYRVAEKTRVGVLGMGELGKAAAEQFSTLGFTVRGWARTPKHLNNVKMFVGDEEYEHFLRDLDILICLLPLTKSTRGILNKKTFDLLPNNAFVINVARGDHLVEEELLEALDEGRLSGACLDVFKEEPLPEGHPFWLHPKVIITPHIASITSIMNVAPQILNNYHRLQSGQPLANEVLRSKGY